MQTRKFKFIIFSILLLSITMMVGCGKNGAIPTNLQVSSITVTCTTCLFPNGATGVQIAESDQIIMDIAEGQVEVLSITILGLNGQALSGPQFPLTYSTNDPSALSISPGGGVCAGVWDAQFINCLQGTIPYLSANDTLYPASITPPNTVNPPPPSAPNPLIGLTISTPGASVTIHVKVHPVIDSITVGTTYPTGSCLSQGQQLQFTADAHSNKYPFPITFDVGFFSWLISDQTVAVVDFQGRAVSRSPGIAYVTAAISLPTGTTSQPFPLVVCPIQSITLSVFSSTGVNGTGLPLNLNAGDKVTLIAAASDTNNLPVATAPLKFSSSQPALIPFTSSGPIEGIVTAAGAGAFSLTASCAPPTCNNGPTGLVYGLPGGPVTPQSLGFGFPIYSNVVQGATAGTSTTNVYVTGNQLPGGHPNHQIQVLNATTLAQVNVIDLPYVPNSMVFDPLGETAYIGTDDTTTGATLMQLGVGLTNATTFTGKVVGNTNLTTVTGKVLGVSPDGTIIIVSDLVNNALFVVSRALNTAQYYAYAGITSVSFSPDGTAAFLSGTSGIFTLSTNLGALTQIVNTGTNLNSSLSFLPEGFAAVGSNVSNDETSYAVCNSQVDTTPVTTNAGLITAVQSSTATNPHVIGAAVDGSGWIDTTVAIPAPTPTPAPPLPPACQTPPSVTLTPANVGATLASCTPVQGPIQITALNSGNAVFATGVNPAQCLTTNAIPMYNVAGASAGSISLSSSGILVGGSATLDSNTLIVGTTTGITGTDTAYVHLINLTSNTDTVQVSVPFIPNFIAVLPK